ncbi:MAG TPA: hypothetical protein PLU04_13225 [Anaerolineaceae bacterium]|nr:hypothetical protein [Anaerolineaceae bacterium]
MPDASPPQKQGIATLAMTDGWGQAPPLQKQGIGSAVGAASDPYVLLCHSHTPIVKLKLAYGVISRI